MLILLDDINVGERMRVDYGDVESLVISLKNLGQIQPIAIDKDKNLIAGGRRYAAFLKIREDYEDQIEAREEFYRNPIQENQDPPPIDEIAFNPNYIEAYSIDDPDELLNKIREYEENMERKDFTWQEGIVACYKLHQLYSTREKPWSANATARRMGRAASWVKINIQIAKAFLGGDNEIVLKDTRFAAIQYLKNKKESAAQRKLSDSIERRRGKEIQAAIEISDDEYEEDDSYEMGTDELVALMEAEESGPKKEEFNPDEYHHDGAAWVDSSGNKIPYSIEKRLQPRQITTKITAYHTDAISALSSIKDDSIDLVVTDPPFGIELEKLKKSDLHAGKIYGNADTADAYKELMFQFIPLLFRKMKHGSHVYMFFAPQYYSLIYDTYRQVGFGTYAMPMIWHRLGGGQSMNPDRHPASCYESFIFAWKPLHGKNYGNALYKKGASNVLPFAPLPARDKMHPAEKPPALWNDILERSTTINQELVIADFFAGSGSLQDAIINSPERKLWNCIYVEREEDYFLRGTHRFREAGADVEIVG